MECQDCREDLINKIGESTKCTKAVGIKLDSKLSLRNFGIAIFCLAIPIFAYLITMNVLVANCADEDDQVNFEKFVIQQVGEIKASVDSNSKTFEGYIERTEKRDDKQEERIRSVERRLDSHHVETTEHTVSEGD